MRYQLNPDHSTKLRIWRGAESKEVDFGFRGGALQLITLSQVGHWRPYVAQIPEGVDLHKKGALKPYDVISSVDGKQVAGALQAYKAARASVEKIVTLVIRRYERNQQGFFSLNPGSGAGLDWVGRDHTVSLERKSFNLLVLHEAVFAPARR